MRKYDIALFDLDGTLSESAEGILECVKIAFREMKRELPDEKTLAGFIGPPMTDSLKRCGFSEKMHKKACRYTKRIILKRVFIKIKFTAECMKLCRH